MASLARGSKLPMPGRWECSRIFSNLLGSLIQVCWATCREFTKRPRQISFGGLDTDPEVCDKITWVVSTHGNRWTEYKIYAIHLWYNTVFRQGFYPPAWISYYPELQVALKVNEVFYSIQGESTHAGRACVFVRLAGCNLRCTYCVIPGTLTKRYRTRCWLQYHL